MNSNSNLVEKIASIANNHELSTLARNNNLVINSVTWEDTGRYKGSCWGPNISDMTLRLDKEDRLLPVIRRENFSDVTADLDIEQFMVPVGNEAGTDLKKISLKEYLSNASKYIQTSESIEGLYNESRDKQILTSAQYCILPLAEGTCEFNVNLFNYQSSSEEPGVLVLVVSQQGTSAQVLEGNSPLYFNDNGRACNFIAERMKDVRIREDRSPAMEMSQDEKEKNCLFIFQIPLVVKNSNLPTICYSECMYEQCMLMECVKDCDMDYMEKGMDDAVLSKGIGHSDFKGVMNKKLERDTQFPIRCTVQFYKVTDSTDIPEAIFQDIDAKIKDVYTKGVCQGSLVTEGSTGRSTEWTDKP